MTEPMSEAGPEGQIEPISEAGPLGKPSLSQRERVSQLVYRLDRLLSKELSSGELVQLRRPNSDGGGGVFWRLLFDHVEAVDDRLGLPALRREAEPQWTTLLAGMAHTAGFHDPQRRLGSALGAAGFSEQRFERLLRARDSALLDAVLAASRFLAAKAEKLDWRDLIHLVLSQQGPSAETTRRAIARDYYATLRRAGSHAEQGAS